MITYQGVDMLAKLLAGQGMAINAMYMEFVNEPNAVPVITPDPADGRNYYAALEVGGIYDYIRIPFSNVPVVSSTDLAKFVSNKATFFAMSTGIPTGRGGHPFSAGSQVYGIALVCAPNISDADYDIVFSRNYDFTAITKEAGQEISMTQAHIFTESIV